MRSRESEEMLELEAISNDIIMKMAFGHIEQRGSQNGSETRSARCLTRNEEAESLGKPNEDEILWAGHGPEAHYTTVTTITNTIMDDVLENKKLRRRQRVGDQSIQPQLLQSQPAPWAKFESRQRLVAHRLSPSIRIGSCWESNQH